MRKHEQLAYLNYTSLYYLIIPAKARIQSLKTFWILAFAGMTVSKTKISSTHKKAKNKACFAGLNQNKAGWGLRRNRLVCLANHHYGQENNWLLWPLSPILNDLLKGWKGQ